MNCSIGMQGEKIMIGCLDTKNSNSVDDAIKQTVFR